jgi:chaperonin cofactor prefoldin
MNFLFATGEQYQRGGSISDIENNIARLEKKQIQIENHLTKINDLMGRYNTFANSYLERISSIIKQGANCMIDNQNYLYYKSKYGIDNDYTVMYKRFNDECESMKKTRLEALKTLDERFDTLESKVSELNEQKRIDVSRAERIKGYINDLRRDKEAIQRFTR